MRNPFRMLAAGAALGAFLGATVGLSPAPAQPTADACDPSVAPTERGLGSQHRSYCFTAAGQEMPYRLYVPTTWDGEAALPLILFLHGAGSDENRYIDANDRQLERLAEEHGYILAAPLGYSFMGAYGAGMRLGSSWGEIEGQRLAREQLNADPARLRELELSELDTLNVLDRTIAEYGVDPGEVFLMGHSMVERMDAGVGAILAALEENGLGSDTLVIFTNDNGGEWLSDGGPVFHRKWTLWEGGLRVPAIVRWPGRIPARQVVDQVGVTMDLTATVLAAAGEDLSSGGSLDGRDLMPVLTGEAALASRDLFWRTSYGGADQRAVRSGDWKLIVDGGGLHTMLFNVGADPGERHEIIREHPDIARDLLEKLDAWTADVDARAASSDPEQGLGD